MQIPWRRYTILAALALFPLSYGTVHPLPILGFQLAGFWLFAWRAFDAFRSKLPWKPFNDPLLRLGGAAVALGLFQLIPLPVEVLAWVSPGTYDLLSLRAAAGLETPRWHTIAVVPWAAEQGVLWLAALVAWYAVLRDEAQNRRGAVAMARTVGLSGVVLALLGLFQTLTAARSIFWVGLERNQFYATFVNPNNAAGVLAIATLACLASAAVTPRKGSRPLWYAGALICAASTMVSLSRAGVAVLIFGLLVAAFWTHRAGLEEAETRRRSYVPLALIGATLLFMAWIGSTELLGEFEKMKYEGRNLNGRTDVWKVALLEMFPKFPLFGAGFGNFPEVFPVYQEGPVRVHIQSAENEYLQAVFEGGLVGALLAVAALITVVSRLRRTVAGAKRLGLGIPFSAALAALLLHMLVDFPLHVGGSALWILVCVAMVSRDGALQAPPERPPVLQT